MAKAMTKNRLIGKIAERASITRKAADDILNLIFEEAAKGASEMKANPVGWFEIYVQNLRRAKKFYESVFQVTLKKLNNPKVDIWAFPSELDQWGRRRSLDQNGRSRLGWQQHHGLFQLRKLLNDGKTRRSIRRACREKEIFHWRVRVYLFCS